MVFGGFVLSGIAGLVSQRGLAFFLVFFFLFLFFREMLDGGRGLLGPPHLLLDFFDLLTDTHGGVVFVI